MNAYVQSLNLMEFRIWHENSMTSEFRVRILKTLPEIEEIRPIWGSWPGHRDSDIDMFSAVVASNPETLRPHVIVAYRDGRPDAILIGRIDLTTQLLRHLRVGYWLMPSPRVRLLTFVIGAQRGNSSPEVSELLLREAVASLRRGEADLARLEYLEVGTPLYRLARSLPGILGRDHCVLPQPHWYMELSGTYEEVFSKRLSTSLRWEFRRKAKGIQAAFSSVVVRCFEKPEDLETLMHDVESIAAKSYQRGLGVGFDNSEETRNRLLWQLRKGWLLAYVLYLDGKAVAFWIGTLYQRVFYGEFIGFDPAYSKYSPGTFLEAKGLEDLCARQAASFDIGLGDAQYKARLGTTCREEATVYFYAPTLFGAALSLLITLMGLAKRTSRALATRSGLSLKMKKVWRGKKTASPVVAR